MNFKSFLLENQDYMTLLEGTMSDIHQLASDSKDIESFAKDFFKQFGAKIKKTTDSVEWVKSLYNEVANEAYDGNIKDFKYEFPNKFEEATGNSVKAIKKISKKGKSGYEVRTSTYMSEPEMKLVADAMGMELKSYEKSTNIAISVFESASVTNEAFSRMSKDTIENELYKASQELSKYYDWLEAGNDSGKGETLNSIIDLLKKCKSNIKRFNKPEEVKGTVYESLVTEKFKFSKKEVEAAANLIASAISQADMVKAKVHDLEYVKGKGAGFEISIDGEKYDGGSYTVKDNGDVVNAAIGNKHPNAVYNTIGNKDIADVFINMEKYESVVTEAKITLKRRYTENHPALTVGKHAKIRNKMLEAIGDGNITQEEFNNILKELSTNGKRWTKSNSKYFSVSEEGISLTKFGSKALASITINEEEPINTKPLEMKLHEATDENPKIWVPGGFDKAISKLPNSQITRDVVLKVAKKHKVNPEEAISYVEYGWSLDLNENKNTNMKTKFIHESFGDFINSLNESESLVTEAKSAKVTKKEWPYVEFKVGSKLHKVEFDYEDVIDNHGNEGQDQYWLGKDDDGKEWSIDVYADYNGDVQDVHYDTIVAESVVNEGKEADEAEAILNDLLDERGGDFDELRGMSMEDALDTVGAYGHKGSKAKKIAQELVSMTNESVINEAFKSSKLRNLLTMTDSMTYGDKADAELPKAFYQLTKMKLDQIGDEDLIDMTPKEAYKAYANDRDTVVFYIVDNAKHNPFGTGQVAPGVLALTRGKDFLGVKYESTGYRRKSNTKTLKGGDDRMAVGGNKAYKGYDATGVSSIKRAADLADRAVAFSLSNLTKSSRSEIAARVDQKSGATAFMNDKDFKDANKARYQEILATKASKLPLDKMVADSIDALTAQIKDGLAKNEKGRYGDIIIGRNSKGREAKMRDASNHMSTILDDYGRYVDYIKQAEEAKAEKYASNYAEKEAKNYAKEIKDKVSKIKKFDYAW